ncbi:hypothetical protein SeLEV6574_g06692 [Synchytrium endobioticum]|uniref:Uncharacterized protein n=1 Tax=Synchytrium endobioticum TaxID=286115 RepID=A0A507CMD2_9FUNG|nr:hypothetical protein SeLEV6574_g06692 [Synchytrium endobioticum]
MFSQSKHNMPPNNGEENRLEGDEDDLLSYDGIRHGDHATGLGDGLQLNPMAPFIPATSVNNLHNVERPFNDYLGHQQESSVPSARVPL